MNDGLPEDLYPDIPDGYRKQLWKRIDKNRSFETYIRLLMVREFEAAAANEPDSLTVSQKAELHNVLKLFSYELIDMAGKLGDCYGLKKAGFDLSRIEDQLDLATKQVHEQRSLLDSFFSFS